jgi:SsrA-binding protein
MKIVAKNKRGTFDYAIDQRIVAGLVLSGPEVKSAKNGEISLKGSYVSIRGGEAYLVNAHIRKYANSSAVGDYDPTRPRKLLVHKKQLDEMINAKHANVQAVPLAVGVSRGLVKLEIGLGRGQRKYDKRHVIKARQTLRDMAREIKSKN